MIRISISKKDNKISFIKIAGHANYASEGYDIVCASVSSIVTTSVNGLLSIDASCLTFKDVDDLEITILKHNEVIDALINNMLSLLQQLSEQYKKYIKIKK
ncbi:MAG: ribosomal-processing cysteine protease Prp [Bacilli bacterium]